MVFFQMLIIRGHRWDFKFKKNEYKENKYLLKKQFKDYSFIDKIEKNYFISETIGNL